MGATASTVDLSTLEASKFRVPDAAPPGAAPDRLWRHSAATWTADCLVLIVLTSVTLAGTAVVLRRRDPRFGQ
jgi:hypothetical protein